MIVGLQEVEMGTASVAMGAVKERMARLLAEQGNQNAKWWNEEILYALECVGTQGARPDSLF